MGNLENIGLLHENDGARLKAEWQAKNKDTVITSGWCKLGFGERETGVEKMWVKIIKSKGGMYQGILDNDPIFNTHLSAGDVVTFEHEDIEDYLEEGTDVTI